jgi:hypothetical protein
MPFEVFTALMVTFKSTVFWEITTCWLVDVGRYFTQIATPISEIVT